MPLLGSPPALNVRPTIRTLVLGALAITVLFVGFRFAFAAHRDASRFVLAGAVSTDAGAVHDHLYVAPGGGYDGQFYYRMARAPLDFDPIVDGIHIDSPIRYQRIVYPALAYVASAGNGAAVPWALIAVNVAMMLVLVAACGAIAVESGRDPAWGLLAAGFFGLLLSVGRDLTEPTEVAFLACGILAMRRGRTGWAALAFSAAVLSRETAIVVVGAYLAVTVAEYATHRARPSWRDGALLLPVVVFAAWESVVREQTGTLALRNPSGDPPTVPFVGIARALPTWLSHLGSSSGLLLFLEAFAVVALVTVALGGAIHVGWGSRAHASETLALVLIAVFTVALPKSFWIEYKDFRTIAELWLLGGIVFVTAPRRNSANSAVVVVGLAGLAFLGVFGFRAFVI